MFAADGGSYWFNRDEVLLLEGFRELGETSSESDGGSSTNPNATRDFASTALSDLTRFVARLVE
jgi:hypothetical protein